MLLTHHTSLPLVSITVPAYNQAQYLRPCLDSLWFQDYPRLEIVVVNDGATDQTAAVLESFQQDIAHARASYASHYDTFAERIDRTSHLVYRQDGRSLRVVTHPHNRGLAAALNTGWQHSTGEFTTYVPCDDIAYPHMIACLVDALKAKDAEFAYGDMHIVDDAMHILRRFALPEYSFRACFGDWYLCGVCKLYKRSLHAQYGGYEETLLAHDHALFQRFALGGVSFVHVKQALLAVRDHPESRQVDIHAPANWSRLLEESKALVVQAREHLAKQGAAGA